MSSDPLILPGGSDKGDGPGDVQNVFFWVRGDKENPTSLNVALLTGSSVDTWLDQCLYHHHAFGFGTARPTYTTSLITCGASARAGLVFDGSNDFLQTSIIEEPVYQFTDKEKFSVHMAFKAPVNNTDSTLFSIGHTGVGRDGISVSLVPNGVVARITLALDCGGTGFVDTTFTFPGGLIYANSSVHTISFMFDGTLSSNQLKLVLDNLSTSITVASLGMRASSNRITIGRDYGGGHFYTGDLLEIISQSTALDDDRALLYNYYVRKWCAV